MTNEQTTYRIKRLQQQVNSICCKIKNVSIIYQANSNTFPQNLNIGSWLIVTDNGTESGNVLEMWIFNGTTWNEVPTSSFTLPQNVVDALLNSNSPSLTNPYATLLDIPVPNDIIVVINYSALPNPTTVATKFYWVSNSQGTQWLPGSLGGTYYPKGLYYSNGVSWEYMETPYQATQLEVNTGTNNDKFVTPNTLSNSIQWNTKQDTLVSSTNIRTVNGNTLLGSTDLVINTPPSGLTGQIQFNNGGAFGADSNLFWDNTNKRLGIGATPASTVRLDVRAQGALSTDIAFRVRNSADSGNLFTSLGSAQIIIGTSTTTPEGQILARHDFSSAQPILTLRNGQYGNLIFQVRDERTTSGASTGSFRINGIINGGESGSVKQFDFGGHGLGVSYGDNANNAVWLNNQGSVGDGNGSSVISVSSNFYINRQTVKVFKFIPNFGNFGVNVMTFGTSATNTFAVANGVAPTTSPADAFQQYSADIAAGNAAPHFRTENGSIIKLYQQSAVTTTQGIADVLTNLGVLSASTIAPTVQSVVSAATVTPVNGNDLVKITAQAAALTLANPTGTWSEGKDLMIRIKDDGTARAITWDTNYRAIGVTLPTTTVISKTTYVGIIYNSTDGKWDVIGVTTQA